MAAAATDEFNSKRASPYFVRALPKNSCGHQVTYHRVDSSLTVDQNFKAAMDELIKLLL